MKKKLLAMLLVSAMTFSMAMPVFATESQECVGSSGTTTLSGTIEVTNNYTLYIPSNNTNMGLNNGAVTDLGSVRVTKQNGDTAQFNPEKKVNVSVEYNGELTNSYYNDEKITYKLQQSKADPSVVTEIKNGDYLEFLASEIDAGTVSYNLKAVITESNTIAGTYTETINFKASIENAPISFTVTCRGCDKTYECETISGTVWNEYIEKDTRFKVLDQSPYNICCACCDVYLSYKPSEDTYTDVFGDLVINRGNNYYC